MDTKLLHKGRNLISETGHSHPSVQHKVAPCAGKPWGVQVSPWQPPHLAR